MGYLIHIWTIFELQLNLFWTDDTSVPKVPVRDIYRLEFDVLKNPVWAVFYIISVCVFMAHAVWGWAKVTPVLGVPRGHIKNVERIGNAIFFALGAIYISFPVYVLCTRPTWEM